VASLRVPWVLPIQSGPDAFPGVGRVPSIVRVTLGIKPDLTAEQVRYLVAAGQEILNRRRGDFLGYYTQASNAYHAGIVNVMSRHWQFDEGMAMYKMNNGMEYLDIIIYPDLEGGSSRHSENDWDYLRINFTYEWPYIDDPDYSLAIRCTIKSPTVEKMLYMSSGRDSVHDSGPYRPGKNLTLSPQELDWLSDTDHLGVRMGEVWCTPNKPDKTLVWFHDGAGSGTTTQKSHHSFLVDLRNFPKGPISLDFHGYWTYLPYNNAGTGREEKLEVKVNYVLWKSAEPMQVDGLDGRDVKFGADVAKPGSGATKPVSSGGSGGNVVRVKFLNTVATRLQSHGSTPYILPDGSQGYDTTPGESFDKRGNAYYTEEAAWFDPDTGAMLSDPFNPYAGEVPTGSIMKKVTGWVMWDWNPVTAFHSSMRWNFQYIIGEGLEPKAYNDLAATWVTEKGADFRSTAGKLPLAMLSFDADADVTTTIGDHIGTVTFLPDVEAAPGFKGAVTLQRA
jgi:hypothetical protein